MVRFHGDLLMGGVALRNLEVMISLQETDNHKPWSGRFKVKNKSLELLEMGRQYLLLLDNGRSAHVVVTRWSDPEASDELQVEFEAVE